MKGLKPLQDCRTVPTHGKKLHSCGAGSNHSKNTILLAISCVAVCLFAVVFLLHLRHALRTGWNLSYVYVRVIRADGKPVPESVTIVAVSPWKTETELRRTNGVWSVPGEEKRAITRLRLNLPDAEASAQYRCELGLVDFPWSWDTPDTAMKATHWTPLTPVPEKVVAQGGFHGFALEGLKARGSLFSANRACLNWQGDPQLLIGSGMYAAVIAGFAWLLLCSLIGSSVKGAISSPGADRFEQVPLLRAERSPDGERLALDRLAEWMWLALACGLGFALLSYTVGNPQSAASLVGLIVLTWRWRCLPEAIRSIFERVATMSTPLKVFLLALLLRVVWIGLTVGLGKQQLSDFGAYQQMAMDIFNGDYRSSDRNCWPLGAPLFFAAHFWLFGPSTLYALITLSVLSASQCILTYSIALQAIGKHRVAAMAALILAVWPESVLYANLVGSDVLFSTIVLVSVWLVSRSLGQRGWRSAMLLIAAGACIGVSRWVRVIAPLYMVAALIYLLFRNSRWTGRLTQTGAFVVGIGLAGIAGGVISHTVLGGASILPAQKGGWSMLVGTSLQNRDVYDARLLQQIDERIKLQQQSLAGNAPTAWDQVARQMAIDNLRTNAWQILLMNLRYKIPCLWGQTAWLGDCTITAPHPLSKTAALTWGSNIFHWEILILAVAGILYTRRTVLAQWTPLTIYLLIAIGTGCVHLVLEVAPRYHHALLPMLAILAALHLHKAPAAAHTE